MASFCSIRMQIFLITGSYLKGTIRDILAVVQYLIIFNDRKGVLTILEYSFLSSISRIEMHSAEPTSSNISIVNGYVSFMKGILKPNSSSSFSSSFLSSSLFSRLSN